MMQKRTIYIVLVVNLTFVHNLLYLGTFFEAQDHFGFSAEVGWQAYQFTVTTESIDIKLLRPLLA